MNKDFRIMYMLCGLSLLAMCIPKLHFVSQDQVMVVDQTESGSNDCCTQDMKSMHFAVGSTPVPSSCRKTECANCCCSARDLAWNNRRKYSTECVSIIDMSELRDMRKAMWRERNNMVSN